MAREKKSMIGFDPLAWLDEDAKPGDESADDSATDVKQKASKKNEKPAKTIVQVLGHSIDETALLKGYELASSVMDEVVTDFYNELFLQHPEVAPLFENTSEAARAVKLGAALKVLIDYLHDESVLKITLTDMGERHQKYGALPEHYSIVAELLVASFKKVIGRSWTKAISAAWLELLNVAAETMCAAYTDDAANEGVTETETVVMSDEQIDSQSEQDEPSVEADHPVLQLNSIQDISKSQALKNDIIKLINDNDEIDIDAQDVERIDGSALQLLCALFNYAQQNNLVINWIKPSEALISAVDTLGMKKNLELS